MPPIAGLAGLPFLSSETVFNLREPVPPLLVLGGGPIGVELAQAFARLGSVVTLVERGLQLLPVAAAVVGRRLRAEGVKVLLDSEVLGAMAKPAISTSLLKGKLLGATRVGRHAGELIHNTCSPSPKEGKPRICPG